MLTKEQKKYLKSLSNNLTANVIIGKNGLNQNIIESLDECLYANELVKISLLKSCDLSIDEVTIELAAQTNSEIIQKIGRKVTLYRYSKENHKINLPR